MQAYYDSWKTHIRIGLDVWMKLERLKNADTSPSPLKNPQMWKCEFLYLTISTDILLPMHK